MKYSNELVYNHGYLENLDMNETEITEFSVPMWAEILIIMKPFR